MKFLENLIGQACKLLLPIPEEVYFGNPNSSVAICTLSNISLLKELSTSTIMNNICIVGRLLSENKGIDSLINNVINNPKISTLIICGNDVWGHKSGHSLLKLYKNGISSQGRIIDSISPDPFLTTSLSNIRKFQKQIRIVNKIGETDSENIVRLVQTMI